MRCILASVFYQKYVFTYAMRYYDADVNAESGSGVRMVTMERHLQFGALERHRQRTTTAT